MKRILIFGMMVAIVSLAIVSCKDDFNEEEFLTLQSKIKLQQDSILRARNFDLIDQTSEDAVKEYIAAINEAGDLLAVSLIVRENGNPLPGVTVTFSSGTANEVAGGRTKAIQTAVTDATGNVVFDRVTIGSGTATFSKNGYISATATYDFGQPGLPTAISVPSPVSGGGLITKYIPPIKRYEEAAVPMLSATPSEGSTATITGFVTIENDLTNTTPEVPTGLVLRANLSSLVTGTQGFFSSYTLEDDTNLGRATIAADGSYTMVVPALAASNTIGFIVPNIEGTARMAVNGYDNGTGTAVALATPEYRNVPTGWGVGVVATATVPTVPGARVVVPPAPAQGSGLSFSVTPVGRTLPTGTISSSTATTLGNTRYRITSRGSFATPVIPAVTVTGGGGSGAEAVANLRFLLTNLVVTNAGTGYDGSVNIEVVANILGGGEDILTTSTAITTDGGKLPEVLNLQLLDNAGFGSDDAPVTIASGTKYTSLQLRVVNGGAGLITDAQFNATMLIELSSVEITEEGAGYTSKPTITIGSGGATIETLEFPVFWDLNPTMGAGVDYAVMPDMAVEFPQTENQPGLLDASIDVFQPNGISDDQNVTILSQMTINAGDVVKKFPTRTFRTRTQNTLAPTVRITNPTPTNASFVFQANDMSASGAITGLPSVLNVGNGYGTKLTGQIVPTIAGAPGSGATIRFDYDLSATNPPGDFNSSTLEWQFEDNGASNNVVITNQGTGYLPNLNQRGVQNTTLPVSVLVQPGKTFTVNFAYGTGIRRAEVN